MSTEPFNAAVSAPKSRWTGSRSISLGLGATVMGLAILMLFRGPVEVSPKYTGNIREIIPTAKGLPDWKVKDAPIADTPEMQRQVDELLNFDDAVFRIYEKGGLRVSVYLAYWRPGRMQAKDIGRHTPDVCWVAAGWEQTRKDTLSDLRLRNGARVSVAEHRAFFARGQTEHVLFWHVVGAATHSYKTGGRPPWYWIVTDTLRWGLNQRPEQFFLRISSNRPVDEWMNADLVQSIIERVPAIVAPTKQQ